MVLRRQSMTENGRQNMDGFEFEAYVVLADQMRCDLPLFRRSLNQVIRDASRRGKAQELIAKKTCRAYLHHPATSQHRRKENCRFVDAIGLERLDSLMCQLEQAQTELYIPWCDAL